jgi:hypothetical protein
MNLSGTCVLFEPFFEPFCELGANFAESDHGEVRRKALIGTWVNKGKKRKGRS